VRGAQAFRVVKGGRVRVNVEQVIRDTDAVRSRRVKPVLMRRALAPGPRETVEARRAINEARG